MKTILSLIFAFSIVAVFATVSHQSDNVKGEPVKKESASKMEVKKPEKTNLLTCAEELQHQIALCYNTFDADVLIGSVGEYYIYSLAFHGYMSITDCGKNCTYICVGVYPYGTPCCFTLDCDYP